MNRPKHQRPTSEPSEDMQFLAFLGFAAVMIALLGACGAF
tara:strand:- start:4976 stop:5095 length:120 start_codon:yes stop_codon:yes gene_type:complete